MPSDLVNHLWQSTVFAVVAALLSFAFRRNRAQVRYWLWFSASFKFLVPFSLLVSLGRHFARAAAAHNVAAHIAAPALGFAMTPVSASLPDLLTLAPTESSGDWGLIVLAGLWACGFAGIALMRLHGWRRVRAAVGSSAPVELPGLQTKVDVRSSPGLLEPGVVGVFRSVLLLPADLEKHLTPAQLGAVLAHELCHVRRRDNLFASIHMLVEAIFWFHPLVWWIGARMVEERERACDEEVLSAIREPRSYAEGILNVCRLYVESPLACVAGITGANLKRRIESIMTNHIGQRLSLANKVLLASAGVVALAIPLVIGIGNVPSVRAQSSAGSPQFEVTSVKENKTGGKPTANFPLGPGDAYIPNGGLFSATGWPFLAYIMFAYQIMGNQQPYLQPQLPDWAKQDRFDIQARAQGNPGKDQMRLMMRALLADRFKLAIHYESRQVPVLLLALSKPGKIGPQLRRHPDDSLCSTDVTPQPGTKLTPPRTVPGGFPALCGTIIPMPPSAPGRYRMGARNVAISSFADLASGEANRRLPILDRTGLTGTVDFTLEWTPEPRGPVSPTTDAPPDTSGPTFEEALREQLGLKLESTKGQFDVLVIDHIEKPSEN